MQTEHLKWIIEQLEQKFVSFEEGLSDTEIAIIENKYRFHFPPDYRQLLQLALPWFVNWRSDPESKIKYMLDRPLEGIKFDIERNSFWMEEWGPKPEDLADALRIAEIEVRKAPILIPVHGHRFIPVEPELPGNPVFSVVQTDIIFYGYDLASYFANEFYFEPPDWAAKEPRAIRFWDRVIEMNNE